MQIRCVVKDAEPVVKSGVAKRTQKPYSMRIQSVWVDLGKPYPNEVQVVLSDTQAPYPVGNYVLGDDALHVTGFGDLAVDMRKMKPVVQQAQQQAAR